jgi:hypothetical protein
MLRKFQTLPALGFSAMVRSGIVLFSSYAAQRMPGAPLGINQLQASRPLFAQYRNSLPDTAIQTFCFLDSSDNIALYSDEYPKACWHFSHRTFSK